MIDDKNVNPLQLLAVVFISVLSIEVLAAEYLVTRTDDPVPRGCSANNCSLREAIIAANNSPGKDTILLTSETYELTRAGIDDTAENGDFDILDDLTIQQAQWPDKNNDPFHIMADINDRVIDVHPEVSLTLVYGVVSGGDTSVGSGGGIRANHAEVLIENCKIKSNSARNGGALHLNQSHAEIGRSSLLGNTATDSGGAVRMVGMGSQLLMDEVTISANEAKYGGGLYFGYLSSSNSQPDVHISNSFFSNNQADYGGALSAQGSFGETTGSVLIEETVFKFNDAKKMGGAIFHIETDLTIKDSLFRTNKAESDDPIVISDGGAIYSGIPFQFGDVADLVIENSLFEENWANDNGGALHLADNIALITNTTFSGNDAGSHADISAAEGELKLQHVTVVAGEASSEIGVYIGLGASGEIQNSIISGRCQMVSFAGFQSLGGNIESPGDTCGLGGGLNDLVTVAPRFLKMDDGLADNGGTTPTHAIRYDYSYAVGNAVPINNITHDQRHMSRDAMPDSGAFEVHESDLILIFKDGFE